MFESVSSSLSEVLFWSVCLDCQTLFLLLAFAFLVPGFAALSFRVRGALVGLVGFGVGLGLGRVDLVTGVVHDLEFEVAAG